MSSANSPVGWLRFEISMSERSRSSRVAASSDSARVRFASQSGIACRRWVTFHGLALNVSTDLSYFHRINPCGFEARVMTSMARELGRTVDMAEVKAHLAEELGVALGRSFMPAAR